MSITTHTSTGDQTVAFGELTWQQLARDHVHPLMLRILEILDASDEALSPKQLSMLLEEKLGNVSYHVRQALSRGYIELVDTQPRRGAVEHFYRLRVPR